MLELSDITYIFVSDILYDYKCRTYLEIIPTKRNQKCRLDSRKGQLRIKFLIQNIENMAHKKKVFISYDYDKDKQYKNLLLAWDRNKLFDFSIHDHSADVSIHSTNAIAIKSVISRYINEATYFLIIVGEKAHTSSWVKWEIEKAVELRKKIVAVKTDRENLSPPALLGIGASWAMSFSYEAISKAINNT